MAAEVGAREAICADLDINGTASTLAVPVAKYGVRMEPAASDVKFSIENEGRHDHGALPDLKDNYYANLKESLRVRAVGTRHCVGGILRFVGPTASPRRRRSAK